MKKIIILIYLALFFLVGIRVYSQEPPSPVIQGQVQPRKLNSESSTKNNIKTKGNNNISPDSPPTINKIDTHSRNTTAQNGYEKNNNSKFSTIKDDPITAYTFWLMIFTGLLVVCNILLWIYTKKTANAAQKAAEALPLVERAYVFTELGDADIQPDHFDSFGNRVGFMGHFILSTTVVLSNHGKTPAIISSVSAVISTQPTQSPKTEEDSIPSAGLVLGSEKWHRFPTITCRIGEEELANINSGNTVLFCCGLVEYKDVFKNLHMNSFCWEYKPHKIAGEEYWTISTDHKELNYYT